MTSERQKLVEELRELAISERYPNDRATARKAASMLEADEQAIEGLREALRIANEVLATLPPSRGGSPRTQAREKVRAALAKWGSHD